MIQNFIRLHSHAGHGYSRWGSASEKLQETRDNIVKMIMQTDGFLFFISISLVRHEI